MFIKHVRESGSNVEGLCPDSRREKHKLHGARHVMVKVGR